MAAPSKMAFWIVPRRDRIEQAAARQMCRAGHSNLNWHAETRAAIEVAATDAGRDALSRWDLQPLDDPHMLQILIHADGPLPAASLTYSIRTNGSIVVIACGHDARTWVIDGVDHADRLAGTAGRARIRRQMETFRFGSCASMATALPTARSNRLFLKLRRRADKRPISCTS